ncbi:VOC family protein [Oerskovia sp. M15]
MTSRIQHTTFDARDAYAQSVWWSDVLGYVEDPDDPNLPGHDECMIFPPADSDAPAESRGRILFIEVPEGKELKNRIHLDLRPTDRTRDEEVERLLALGATQLADRRRPTGPVVHARRP